MKKVTIFLFFFLIFLPEVYALDKKTVYFSDCIDGDTAKVLLNNKEIKIRFLAIDTPEVNHPKKGKEPYGSEASAYTCNALKKAKKIEIEYDSNSSKFDKYNRHLVWVFVDNNLLQSSLIDKGLAKVAYLYDDYKYTSILEAKELIAKKNHIGVWNEQIDYTKIIISILIIIITIILMITNKTFRTKTNNKIKRKVKKEFKKILK